jgi:hypothetical protein
MSAGSIFSAQIAEFVAKAKENADLVVRKVALEMFTRVVIKSPVDEGRFKSSWVVAINSIPGGDPGTIDKTGAPSIMRIDAAVLNLKAGTVITMCSNLSYSRRLEYGWSKQAPAGMVRITVVEFAGIVNQAAAELPR